MTALEDAGTEPTERSRHRTAGRRRHSGRHRTTRRRRILLAIAGAGLLLTAVFAALAVFRYLPALDDARGLQASLERVVARAKDAGLGMDRSTLVSMEQDLADARQRFVRLDGLLADDPLVAAARILPPSRDAILGADAIAAAGGDLLDAADAGIALTERYVSLRERPVATTGAPADGSILAGLVELMATGGPDVDRIVAATDRANAALALAPSGLPGPLATARDRMAERLAEIGPALRTYAELDGTLPAILGRDGPRRYLVLTQNPAELRATGGFIGSFGTVTFDHGRLTERAFQDVFLLDIPWDYPFIKAPAALSNYLLGPKQPWQLADANWSPDFPTSAQDAIRLYRNEGGTGAIDGVLGITTYTIDELLAITGPVAIPAYGVTVASGETTIKTLQNTRVATDPKTNRKAFLSSFAERLFDVLLALPPGRWADLAATGGTFQSERLLQAWFVDPAAQQQIATLGFAGAVRTDPGDYVYPVDSNVSPVSKLNAVTDRTLDLDVQLDAYGNALDTLTVHWKNRIATADGLPYRRLPTLEKLTTLGMYFRLYVPERSRVESVSAGTTSRILTPAAIEDDAGRTVIANYFRIPPGSASLAYTWTSPYAADLGEDGIATYRLTIQRQPGQRSGPLGLRITLPSGATFVDASPGLALAGSSATANTTVDGDVVVVVRYRPAPEG